MPTYEYDLSCALHIVVVAENRALADKAADAIYEAVRPTQLFLDGFNETCETALVESATLEEDDEGDRDVQVY